MKFNYILFFYSYSEPRVDSSSSWIGGSAVWSLLPEAAKPDSLMPEGLILPDRPVALSMSDAAATAAAVASYGYP